MPMLYQLSYSPIEFEIRRKVNTRSLAVSRRRDTQLDLPPLGDERARKKVAAVETTPLDLHAKDLLPDLERKVVATVLHDRAQHRDVQLGRCRGDLRLGYGSFPVSRKHERMFAHAPDGIGQPTERAGASPHKFSSL
jgi:hypothetical protein